MIKKLWSRKCGCKFSYKKFKFKGIEREIQKLHEVNWDFGVRINMLNTGKNDVQEEVNIIKQQPRDLELKMESHDDKIVVNSENQVMES
jgi:hypothetical protein